MREERLVRIGTLDARAWRLKLYASALDAAGLRREDRAAAERAFRAVLAQPGRALVVGFAILAVTADTDLSARTLVLTACHWEGTTLRRCALLVQGVDEPVRRLPGNGFGSAELQLAACEDTAWQRHVEQPSPDTLAAYLAENCA